MNADPNEFETLRKLMALKRHEQPPPEYLSGLPDTIIHRIEQGECRLTLLDKISGKFAMRPTLVYACGLTVCGALGLSVVYLARQGMKQAATVPNDLAARIPVLDHTYATQLEPVTAPIHVANWLGNTNPTSDSGPLLSLFGSPHATVQVSYHSGN